MIPRDRRISFTTAAIAQITLSPVKLCVSLSEVDCFRALLNDTLLQTCNVCDVSKGVCILLK